MTTPTTSNVYPYITAEVKEDGKVTLVMESGSGSTLQLLVITHNLVAAAVELQREILTQSVTNKGDADTSSSPPGDVL